SVARRGDGYLAGPLFLPQVLLNRLEILDAVPDNGLFDVFLGHGDARQESCGNSFVPDRYASGDPDGISFRPCHRRFICRLANGQWSDFAFRAKSKYPRIQAVPQTENAASLCLLSTFQLPERSGGCWDRGAGVVRRLGFLRCRYALLFVHGEKQVIGKRTP